MIEFTIGVFIAVIVVFLLRLFKLFIEDKVLGYDYCQMFGHEFNRSSNNCMHCGYWLKKSSK